MYEPKDLVKTIQHFIQHNKNAVLDEMLDRFNRSKNSKIEKIMLHEEKLC